MSFALGFSLTIIVIIGVLIWLFSRKADRRRVDRFRDQPELTVQEFWDQFYRETGVLMDVISDALVALEQATGISRGRFRPQDRFSDELAPERGWEF